jgi:hypothetical protein
MPSASRFPPPWSVEETDPCFIVRDKDGRRSPTDRRSAAHLLTRDKDRRFAANKPRQGFNYHPPGGRDDVVNTVAGLAGINNRYGGNSFIV